MSAGAVPGVWDFYPRGQDRRASVGTSWVEPMASVRAGGLPWRAGAGLGLGRIFRAKSKVNPINCPVFLKKELAFGRGR